VIKTRKRVIAIYTFACLNHNRACLSHTCECGYDCMDMTVWIWHFACENRTLRVEMTLMRVKITLCVLISHSCVLKSHSGVCSEKLSVSYQKIDTRACEFHTQTCNLHTFACRIFDTRACWFLCVDSTGNLLLWKHRQQKNNKVLTEFVYIWTGVIVYVY
jgi:hypothetical protein